MASNRNTIAKNMIWRFAERCGAQGVAAIVSIILARLLEPELYGSLALVTVIITILQVFVDSGLGNALIQKQNADETDFSTVFFFNIFMCVMLSLLVFFSAPFIADFYDDTQLTPVIRALSLVIIISGVKNVQQAYVSRHMLFRLFFYSTLVGTLSGAFMGIFLAYRGFGIWALVAQYLGGTLVDTIVLWCTVKWRPQRKFSFERLKGLIAYGWKLLVASLVDTVYNDLRQLIIGKMYSKTDLAYYNRGKQFPYLIVTNTNQSIDSVLFSALSQVQDIASRVKIMTRKAIRTSSFIMWPLMCILFVVAEPFVRLVLTDKWIACVPYIRIFCIIYGFYPIHTANLSAIKAVGRSDLFLKLEIIKKIIGLVVMLCSIPFGVLAMAYSMLIPTLIGTFINAYPNKKLLKYPYIEQLKDVIPSLGLAVIMGIIVFPLKFLIHDSLILMAVQIVCSGAFYLGSAYIIKVDSLHEVVGIIKGLLNRNSTN